MNGSLVTSEIIRSGSVDCQPYGSDPRKRRCGSPAGRCRALFPAASAAFSERYCAGGIVSDRALYLQCICHKWSCIVHQTSRTPQRFSVCRRTGVVWHMDPDSLSLAVRVLYLVPGRV